MESIDFEQYDQTAISVSILSGDNHNRTAAHEIDMAAESVLTVFSGLFFGEKLILSDCWQTLRAPKEWICVILTGYMRPAL